MKDLKVPVVCVLFFSGTLFATAAKTTFPVPIEPDDIAEAPYRFNGVVLTAAARGSGFCAWNEKTFFSAAHVVYDEGVWGVPPAWLETVNAEELKPKDAILSRGYYRFNRYAEIVDEQGASAAFGKDVILGFAFRKLIPGKPAKLNLNGSKDLRSRKAKLITGYPAIEAYTDTPTEGYFMHETGPFRNSYDYSSNGSVLTTRVTTGPGNSGGPVWTKSGKGNWRAAGVLVGGLPSECVVYSMTRDINGLTRSVAPVVARKPRTPFPVNGVGASNRFFPYTRSQKLPDGTDKWSSFIVGVRGFGEGAVLTSVKLDLQIKTNHRGDLQVYVVAPGGFSALLQNEEGAGENDLVFKDLDLTEEFAGIDPTGKWAVRIRDRLKGDVATLKSFRLNVAADPADEEVGGGGTGL